MQLSTFEEIVGQDAAIESIRRAYASGRLPHGLIFAGPAGVGKATTAAALGKLFLCEKPKSDQPCEKCGSCRVFDTRSHPDFHVITKELIRFHDKTGKSKGIDLSIHVIRPELLDKAAMKPAMNVGKVFVVEQAELMNPMAQSAMLKTLEEPIGRAVIILLTDQLTGLLPTVRSRCQVVRFTALDETVVIEQLVKRGVSKENARRAAAISDGSLGAAVRWLDDGVVDAAENLFPRIKAIESGGGAIDLPHWLKASSEAYAEKRLKRDPLSSKDQAIREALGLFLRLASNHFSRRLRESGGDERACDAISAIVRAEEYLDANVGIPLALQQLAVSLETVFATEPADVRPG